MEDKSKSTETPSRVDSDEKLHYQSLTTLFKWAISLMGIISAIIGGIVYSDGREMRAAMREQQAALEKHVAEVNRREDELRKASMDIMKNTREDVYVTSQKAINQINAIRDESTSIARTEAKRRIEDVFADNNVENFIVQVAKDRLEPKVNTLISDRMQAESQAKFDRALDDLASNDEDRQGLATYYLNSIHPREWTTERLRKTFVVLKGITNAMWQSEVCGYMTRSKSPVLDSLLKIELVKYPFSAISSGSVPYLIRSARVDDLSIYVEAQAAAALRNRPQFFYHLLVYSINYNRNLVIPILNNHELVDSYLTSIEQLGRDGIKVSDEYTIPKIVENLISIIDIQDQRVRSTYFTLKVSSK